MNQKELIQYKKRLMKPLFALLAICCIIGIILLGVSSDYNPEAPDPDKYSMRIAGIVFIGCGAVVGVATAINLADIYGI
jgi:cell division protein FtsW (lipid II flippase)